MSWLNTSSIANLAKNALKEAQKTIDKALDIRESEAISNKTADNGILVENPRPFQLNNQLFLYKLYQRNSWTFL